MSADAQIESYLKTVSAQLGAASVAEREKIAAEITAHIYSSVEKQNESVDEVLARLGPAERLGESFREILATCQASRSYSPIVLLMASFRKGLLGILAGLIGVAGYWLGGTLLVFGGLSLIWAATHAGPHKPVPIGTSISNLLEISAGGIFFLLLSTVLLRAVLRLLRRRQSPI